MYDINKHIEFIEDAIKALNERLKTAENNVAKNIIRMGIKNRLEQIERIKNKTL